jgi:hypothetical protein
MIEYDAAEVTATVERLESKLTKKAIKLVLKTGVSPKQAAEAVVTKAVNKKRVQKRKPGTAICTGLNADDASVEAMNESDRKNSSASSRGLPR